ncbi:hypothetical protein [Candidatus Bandiella numerosa]|nr:hypothetical protein [Candidatus Bandiella numerosa]
MRLSTRLSQDPDARWLKKGKKSYFGYKGFIPDFMHFERSV